MRTQLIAAFNRRNQRVAFLIVYCLSAISFIIENIMESAENVNKSMLRYWSDVSLVGGTDGCIRVLVIIMPVISCIIYADSIEEEVREGVLRNIAVRTDVRKYLRMKTIVIFIANFLTTLIPLLINFLMCRITFPDFHYDNKYGYLPYTSISDNSGYYLGNMAIIKGTEYTFLITLNICVFSGILGIAAYAAFLNFKGKEHEIVAGLYSAYILAILITSFTGHSEWSIQSYCITDGIGNISCQFVLIMILLLLSVFFIEIGIRKVNDDLEVFSDR